MKKRSVLLVVATVVVIAIWASMPTIMRWLAGRDEFQTRGAFADQFGAAGSLFSGLAFVGIILTLMFQADELRLQREELKAQREELAQLADAQEEASKALNASLDLERELARKKLTLDMFSEWKADVNTAGQDWTDGHEHMYQHGEMNGKWTESLDKYVESYWIPTAAHNTYESMVRLLVLIERNDVDETLLFELLASDLRYVHKCIFNCFAQISDGGKTDAARYLFMLSKRLFIRPEFRQIGLGETLGT